MMVARGFLDLPDSDPRDAEVILLPLPFEGTVSWGRGTARGPDAVLDASRQVETWDEETDFDLEDISFHWSQGVSPADGELGTTCVKEDYPGVEQHKCFAEEVFRGL